MHDNDLIDAWRALAARSRRRRDADAEDYLQDAVVAALDVRERTGHAPASAGAWLRTVARRREADHVRRSQCERRVTAAAFAEETEDTIGEVLDRHEARWLATHVEQLPAATREVVHALAGGGSQAEVAAELGLTPRAVEGHVRRARLALRRVLQRAGALVGVLLGSRWLRRGLPVATAGVATAVGLSMIGTDGTHRLLPIPPPPQVLPTPDDLVAGERTVYAAGPAALVRPRGAAPGRPRAAVDPTETPAPRPSGTPSPPGGEAPVAPPFVLVPSGGDERTTEFATKRGVTYEVTVAGTYSYNGRPDGLADCGHWYPETEPGWQPYEALIVDGVPAPCSRMPYDPLHTYRWLIVGTGRVVTFRVQDAGGGGDNKGYLVITMTPAG